MSFFPWRSIEERRNDGIKSLTIILWVTGSPFTVVYNELGMEIAKLAARSSDLSYVSEVS